jgi:hypothetical protein
MQAHITAIHRSGAPPNTTLKMCAALAKWFLKLICNAAIFEIRVSEEGHKRHLSDANLTSAPAPTRKIRTAV